jgi:hypothetical protein
MSNAVSTTDAPPAEGRGGVVQAELFARDA